MNFIIDSADNLKVSNAEIADLLHLVYVKAGYTSLEIAEKVFEPDRVRSRGFILTARETANREFAGMIIVVPPTSQAIVMAQENECELHLLAVKPVYRGFGLGRKLIAEAIACAQSNNWSKIILWTQRPMKEAQKLYISFGFRQIEVMTRNGIEFLVYEKLISGDVI